jgi:hypothetical protein
MPGLQNGCLYLIDNELSTNPSSADLWDDVVFWGIVKALVIVM